MEESKKIGELTRIEPKNQNFLRSINVIQNTLDTIESGMRYNYEKKRIKEESRVLREKIRSDRINYGQETKRLINESNNETKKIIKNLTYQETKEKEKTKRYTAKLDLAKALIQEKSLPNTEKIRIFNRILDDLE
ncbi:hypothetical protein HWHPT5561_08595 [Petrotoga sp. HWH.PT.55.6.1]|jgi:hypothetical protein|uniref:hypothetical protein n=1 Tax=unclassified Petrotoga TaxID=2620614 RepID=UPI000CA04E1A|nr:MULTISPECIES: hypothetical protein [unclassified Petrotoga]PNR88507.1 hypothetical protein X925_06205 [Petrotoga sp. 9T1HF07.CasAA.8.2]PNR94432.1 hypothetical protein X926_00375 [Petrotoga sp. HWHPT.55.6.3]RPD35378.1 hypothetical protein HWHPT5561_08595 [Petrotoga sp. HWH.PT.55.6.1]